MIASKSSEASKFNHYFNYTYYFRKANWEERAKQNGKLSQKQFRNGWHKE
jgi:hypothetical protein